MNKEDKKLEMNNFLKSIDGLTNWCGTEKQTIIDSNFFDIDIGWYDLVIDLMTDLIKLGWNKEVVQVKEKFGGLRFYINSASDEVFGRIDEAEDKSYMICEMCGKNGSIQGKGWVKTLCDKCNERWIK